MSLDARALAPWALLLALALLFLAIAVTVGAGLMHDPPVLGHGFLALLLVGVAASIGVGGRRSSMSRICLGLAILAGVFLAAFWWGDVPTARGLVLAGVTIGGLCAAAVLFRLEVPASGAAAMAGKTSLR